MANAFLMAFPYGTIRIMSSYNFSSDNIDEGPPMDENERILPVTLDDAGNCQNGWICEHRWKPIAEMITFRSYVFGADITKRRIFEPHTVGFCREDKGFIVLSSSEFSSLIDNPVFVCVPMGKYCDIIAGYDDNGNCLHEIDVDDGGMAVLLQKGTANSNGVIAIHVGSRLNDTGYGG